MSDPSAQARAALEAAELPYREAMAAFTRFPWRWGRHEGVHLYAQLGPEPSDDDPALGTLFTEELAAEAVAAHNYSLGMRTGLGATVFRQVTEAEEEADGAAW